MAASFEYANITFQRYGDGRFLCARGEINNGSSREYQTAVFRLTLFDHDLIIWTGSFKVCGFRRRQTKPFEVFMEGMEPEKLRSISRYDIFFESGY